MLVSELNEYEMPDMAKEYIDRVIKKLNSFYEQNRWQLTTSKEVN